MPQWLLLLIASLVPIFMLRFVGFISDGWAALGWVTIAATFLIIDSYLPRLRRFVFWIWGGWVVIFLLMPAATELAGSHFPLSREAAAIKSVETDHLTAEAARPAGLAGRMSQQDFCNTLDDIRGLLIRQRHQELIRWANYSGPFDQRIPAASAEIERLIKQNVEAREGCRKFLLGTAASNGWASWWPMAAMLTGALAIAAVLAVALRRRIGGGAAPAPTGAAAKPKPVMENAALPIMAVLVGLITAYIVLGLKGVVDVYPPLLWLAIGLTILLAAAMGQKGWNALSLWAFLAVAIVGGIWAFNYIVYDPVTGMPRHPGLNG